MEYRFLGKSDLKISRIGFGCMSLDPDDPVAEDILNKALEGGINYFDTADLYHQGENEKLLGKAFKGKRNQLVIGTKVGNQWRADGSGWDWNPSRKYILSAVDKSLIRLQTDYIDLYQLHGGTTDDPLEEVIETFEILKASGKIRNYGISSIRPNVIREFVKKSSLVSVMMQYSLLDRRPEEHMLGLLKENQIGVLARGAIAKGLLISKLPERYLDYSVDQVANIARRLRYFSSDKRSSESIAIQYPLDHPAVTSVILGMRTPSHLEHALASLYSSTLSQNEMEKLSGTIPVNYYDKHL